MKVFRELEAGETFKPGDISSTKVCTGTDGDRSTFTETKEVILRHVSVDDTSEKIRNSIADTLRKFATSIEK